jgi:hypothetical protein
MAGSTNDPAVNSTHAYDLYSVGQAHHGVMLPVHRGVASIGGDVQLVVRTDNPYPGRE